MTYYDSVHRFGIQGAREQYETYREQVMACPSFNGADAVCPEGFDVLAEVRKTLND
jgi:hypothetical protein